MAAALEMSLAAFAAFAGREAEELARLDFTAPMKVAAVMVQSGVKENFAGAHDPEGSPWAPLKRERTRNRGKGQSLPLRDTGALMASVTSPSGPGVVREVTASSLTVGTNLDYAGFQQFGTKAIPPRPYLGFSAPLLDRLDQMFGEFLEKSVL